MNSFAHLSFALALSQAFGLSAVVTALASLAPDLDFYLSHRGVMHNPLVATAIIALLPKQRRSVAVGYLSHLLLERRHRVREAADDDVVARLDLLGAPVVEPM